MPTSFSSKKDDRLDECVSLSSHSSESEQLNKKCERSRSIESLWNTLDMDEDIRSIAMPTWCDELSSSSDEEYDPHGLSQSLPIEVYHGSKVVRNKDT